MSDREPAVSVRDLVFRYGNHTVLHGVDLDIRTGEVLGILGPNGAGKSTLIGNLLGLLSPSQGSVFVAGRPPRLAVQDGRVAAMLQEHQLPTFCRVDELLRLVRQIYPHPLDILEAARIAGVENLLARPVDKLSGGQKRRVQFAMAMAANAEMLFLDEPTEGLDVEARLRLWDALRAHTSERTVLFSTHDLSEAERFADRVLVLSAGAVVGLDSPDALRKELTTPRVRFRVAAGHVLDLEQLIDIPLAPLPDGRVEAVTEHSDAVIFQLAARRDWVSEVETVRGTLSEVFQTLMREERV